MSITKSLYSYELKLPDFQALDAPEQAEIQGVLDNALRVAHLRLLSFIEPISPAGFESARRAQLARLRSPWRQSYIEEEARVIRIQLEMQTAWSVRHYLLSWDQPLLALSNYLTEAMPPDALLGERNYDPGPHTLRPARPGGLFVKLMAAHNYPPGRWTWWWPWASLITRADGPLAICLDFERVPETQVRLARQGLKNLSQSRLDDDDARRLSQTAQAALESQEPVYRSRLVFLLRDAREDRLLARANKIKQGFEASLSLSLMAGRQASCLGFFDEQARVDLPYAPRTVLAKALPVAVSGLAGITNISEPTGIYLGFRMGLNAQSLGPVHFRGWTKTNRAYHLGFLGTTGGGKSVSMMALLARERATHGVPIVFLEPMGNARKLARLLGPEGFNDPGLRFHELTWSNIQINPLDWVGENQAEQESQVIAMLQTMLRRQLDNIDRGFVSKALTVVYEGLSMDEREDAATAPRLELLCEALREMKSQYYGDQAEYLAEEIGGLYVSGGLGSIFNRATNLTLDFDGADLFDAQSVAGQDSDSDDFKTLLYFAMFSALVRTCRRDKQANQARPRILAIDEYYAMSRNPFLSKRLEVLIKTARNLKLALWLAEQNLATFSGTEVGKAHDLTSHFMLTNIPFWLIFKQETAEADLARANFRKRLPPVYANFLPQARQGQGVALLDQTTLVNFNLLPSEAEAFLK
jgi:hypothetical protein